MVVNDILLHNLSGNYLKSDWTVICQVEGTNQQGFENKQVAAAGYLITCHQLLWPKYYLWPIINFSLSPTFANSDTFSKTFWNPWIWWVRFSVKLVTVLTLYTIMLFSIHFLRCWQGNLFKNEELLWLVIISFTLVTLMCDSIIQGWYCKEKLDASHS